MQDYETKMRALEAVEGRRTERRAFLRTASASVVAVGGLAALAACNDDDDPMPTPTPSPTPTPTPTPTATANADVDILNFALQLEYLEAQFYSYAVNGTGLDASLLAGTGTQGAVVTGGTAGPRQVAFTDPVIAAYAREIAIDEINHVRFLRTALGSAAAAQPAINISGDATGSFTAAARAAGVVPATGTFDPYASENNFLLGAFIFEDVGVTAYKGASPLITSPVFLSAAAGILAVEAYHAGIVRTVLYRRGIDTPALLTSAQQISDARDSLDGASDLDQGIGTATTANLVPTDANALAFSRSSGQVLNVVFLNRAAVTSGGFFPNGVNGNLRTSAAS